MVKCLSNSELAGFPRNVFKYSYCFNFKLRVYNNIDYLKDIFIYIKNINLITNKLDFRGNLYSQKGNNPDHKIRSLNINLV